MSCQNSKVALSGLFTTSSTDQRGGRTFSIRLLPFRPVDFGHGSPRFRLGRPTPINSPFSATALHQEHEEHEPQAQDGEQPEDVEVGQGRRLLLAEVAERLEGHLLRPGRIARLLHEVGLTLIEEGLHVWFSGLRFSPTRARWNCSRRCSMILDGRAR